MGLGIWPGNGPGNGARDSLGMRLDLPKNEARYSLRIYKSKNENGFLQCAQRHLPFLCISRPMLPSGTSSVPSDSLTGSAVAA